MPNLGEIPEVQEQRGGDYDSHPKIEDLPPGTVIEVCSVDDVGKTPKNNYDIVTITEKTRGTMVSTAAGCIRQLLGVKAAQDKGAKYGKDNPVTCTVGTYQSHGKTCKCLN